MSIWLLIATIAFAAVFAWFAHDEPPRDQYGNKIQTGIFGRRRKHIVVNTEQCRYTEVKIDEASAKNAETRCSVLVIDTETTGLPPEEGDMRYYDMRKAVIEFAFIAYTDNLTAFREESTILKQDEEIPQELVDYHKINNDQMMNEGIDPKRVYNEMLLPLLESRPLIVAHNIDFHINMLARDMAHYGIAPAILFECPTFCTMDAGVDILHIQDKAGTWKRPKLSELFGSLYYGRPDVDITFSDKARSDARMAAACYKKIVKQG